MAFKRTAIPFFELANAAYESCVITFYAVDPTTFERDTTLITLYAGKTGSATLSNPLTLDSGGKFSIPAYAIERFIAVVTDVDGEQHDTGMWEPSLSDADVTAAAASASSAASSSSEAQTAEQNAEAAQQAAEAALASALAAIATATALIGSLKVTSNDSTPAPLASKLTASATSGMSLTEVNDGGNETLAAQVDPSRLTAAAEVDPVNDHVMIYDASAGGARRVPPNLIADEQSLVLASQVYGRR